VPVCSDQLRSFIFNPLLAWQNANNGAKAFAYHKSDALKKEKMPAG